MKSFIFLFVSALLLHAEGFIHWQPSMVKGKTEATHTGHKTRKAKQFHVSDLNLSLPSKAVYILPTLEQRTLSLEKGSLSLPRTGMENYHALVVTQTHNNTLSTSVRYLYTRGRPSKVSPTKITNLHKGDLEIVPILLPREHNHYEGSRSYDFKVRYKNTLLAQHPLTLSTSNGTKKQLKSDENGQFTLTLPNDFKEVKMKRRANKPAEFILSVKHFDQGKTYYATLAMPYYVNPLDYWQTQILALGLVFLGLVFGIYMLRNINKKKKRKA